MIAALRCDELPQPVISTVRAITRRSSAGSINCSSGPRGAFTKEAAMRDHRLKLKFALLLVVGIHRAGARGGFSAWRSLEMLF